MTLVKSRHECSSILPVSRNNSPMSADTFFRSGFYWHAAVERRKNVARLYIHVSIEASPNALVKHEYKTRHVDCPRNASRIPGLTSENWRFSIEAKYARLRTQRVLPPALGGLRFLRAASPGPLRAREYVEEQTFLKVASIIPNSIPSHKPIYKIV